MKNLWMRPKNYDQGPYVSVDWKSLLDWTPWGLVVSLGNWGWIGVAGYRSGAKYGYGGFWHVGVGLGPVAVFVGADRIATRK